jgi:hypothetical protein
MFFSRVYSLGMLYVSILDLGPPSLYTTPNIKSKIVRFE